MKGELPGEGQGGMGWALGTEEEAALGHSKESME